MNPASWTLSTLTIALDLVLLYLFTLCSPPRMFAFAENPPVGRLGIGNPFGTWEFLVGWMERRLEVARVNVSGKIFRCRRLGGEDGEGGCGRDSCVGCGKEVWEGEGVCGCWTGVEVPSKNDEVDREGGGHPDKQVEKEKEELRLVVEGAMSKAAIRVGSFCLSSRFVKADWFLWFSKRLVRNVSSGSQS